MNQVDELNINSGERPNAVIEFVVNKALSEQAYSAAYAKMCHHRKGEGKRQQLKVDLEQTKHKARVCSVGTVRFIGELKMIMVAIMHTCVVKLIKDESEESLECLCKLLSIVGKDLDTEAERPSAPKDSLPKALNYVVSRSRLESGRILTPDELACNGLANLSQTCYMNSVLQSLLTLVPYVKELNRVNSGVRTQKLCFSSTAQAHDDHESLNTVLQQLSSISTELRLLATEKEQSYTCPMEAYISFQMLSTMLCHSRRPAGAEPGASMALIHHIQSGFFDVPSNST
ncbi:Eukaryotic translation initiation factor 4 gamma 3 [Takifugu flavidus]|uniref:Eukaryotic translation initiation factor 4 gamma 3 n=1 Tax=Takifugu flavidus TaxID=433684 RepID=A0A5C6MVN3_9TELE|nr:Eukaryotic translation initiation factor 4 gamma 3 [Takifugu flavidus]